MATSLCMRCVDVNLLVCAHRQESPRHDAYLGWLEAARVGDEVLGISSLVLSGFLRVVTHPRVFREPTPLPEAAAFVDAIRSAPSAIGVAPGARHWGIFSRLCEAVGAKGNGIPDAYLAALAIEHAATWCTADRGFARFPVCGWCIRSTDRRKAGYVGAAVGYDEDRAVVVNGSSPA